MMYFQTLKFSRLLLGAFIAGSLFTGCDKDKDEPVNQTVSINAAANGAQERPNPVTTTGTGTTTGSFNKETNVLTYSVTWTGLSGVATAAHFHGPATTEQVAPPVVTLTIVSSAANGGSASGTATLTDAQEADLLGGRWYVNVHTTQNPGGEVRGQVTVR